MRVPFGALALAFLSFLSFAPPSPARADIQNDIFQVRCMPELDVLEVREIQIFGETTFKAIEQPNKELAERYDLYIPRWYVNSEGDWDNPGLGIRSTHYECRLSSGLVELIILPEPLPSNFRDVDSIAVTLRVAGRLIIDDLPFYPCAMGGPITHLMYNATEGHIMVHGQFGGVRARSSDPKRAFDDTWRLIFVEANDLHAYQQDALDWHAPTPKALTMINLDFAGIDYDNGEGRDLQCRYDGPGSPNSRRLP